MKKSIAIICGAGYVSGKEIMALELAEGLHDNGQSVNCITSQWGDGDFVGRLSTRALPYRRMRLGFISATLTWDAMRMTLDQLWRWPRLILDYFIFLRQEKPTQILHTNWHHLILLWMFLDSKRDWFWVHEIMPDKPQYRRMFGWFAPRMKGFIAVSHATAAALRSLGVPDAKLHVIHNGLVDPSSTDSSLPPQPLGKNIGIIGQVGAWKGHEDLLEAFFSVAAQHPTAILHVFGGCSDDFAGRLKMRANELGIASRVVWHGFIAERKNIYPLIDICVVPSRCEESFGMTVLEAGYFGLPVIVTRRGGLPEVVVDGVTGFIVEGENSQQLATRLGELLGDGSLRMKMGAAARLRAQQYFSRDRFVADFRRMLSGGDSNDA